MAQNYTLQLLRNSTIVDNFEAAKAKLQSFTSTERKDGEFIICRYNEGEDPYKVVKTALGVYYASDNTIKCSIFRDIESLNFTSAGTNGVPIVGITQVDGLVNVSAGNIWASSVDISKENEFFEDVTVEDAITEIASKVNKNQVTNADGTIIVTTDTTTDIKVNVKSDDKILSVDDSKGGVQSTLTVVKKDTGLAANIKESYEVQGVNGEKLGEAINIYKDSSLLSVKLLHAKGDTKPTYDKTSGWADITGGAESDLALCFAYESVNGEIVVEAVPVGDFLRESEFKNGLQVVGGEVSVKIKQNDKYLEVSADGVASKGIDDAIKNAIEAAFGGESSKSVDEKIEDAINALDSEKTSTDGTNVQVEVTQADGLITAVSVTTDNTASTTELASETAARKSVTGVNADTYSAKADANYIQGSTSLKDADEKLDAAIKAVSDKIGDDSVADSIEDALEDLTVAEIGGVGKFIQKISQSNGKIAAAEVDLTAANVALEEVSVDNIKLTSTNVQAAFVEILKNILDNEEVDAAAIVALKKLLGSSVTETLTIEFGGNYTDGATTFQEAIESLDTKLKSVETTANNTTIDCGTY